MKKIFGFWEKVKWYDELVLNEREVRAAAGILFVFAIVSFMNAWLLWDFFPTKIFVVWFMLDFLIRIFINPRFSPSLILGRYIVSHQEVEYVTAIPKRFAWWIGLVLSIVMFFLVVLNNIVGPLNILVCLSCLVLLWAESFFGMCLWCKLYALISWKKTELCPWWSCKS